MTITTPAINSMVPVFEDEPDVLEEVEVEALEVTRDVACVADDVGAIPVLVVVVVVELNPVLNVVVNDDVEECANVTGVSAANAEPLGSTLMARSSDEPGQFVQCAVL